jgi:capsid protein
MFERLQWDEIEYDLEIMNRVLDHAADSGLLTMQQRQAVSIDVQPPTVHVRDKEAEARTREIDIRSGLLSAQTATAESGRDYLREQSNIEEHHERTGLPVSNHRPSDFLNSKPPH